MTIESRPTALIFRKRLLAYSETFVANQGYALSRYRPRFVGFELDKRGLQHLDRSDVDLLSDHVGHVDLARLPMRAGLAPPGRWVRALAEHQPAIIHAHFLSAVTPAWQLAQALGVPLIATAHGNDIAKPLTPKFRKSLATAFSRCTRVIAVSEFIADCLRRAGCPEDKLVLHYMGIPLKGLEASLVPKAPTVLMVGRFVEKKGIRYLLEAMARVRVELPQARLKIIGDGPLRAELQAQADQLQLKAEFLGVQPPDVVHRNMREARLLAAPSVRTEQDAEGLGMVFLEAQALGRPVVGFASGGIGEAVAADETGLLCVERDVDRLVANLLQVLRDDALATRLGEAGAKRVRQRFDVLEQTRQLESLYDAVCTPKALA